MSSTTPAPGTPAPSGPPPGPSGPTPTGPGRTLGAIRTAIDLGEASGFPAADTLAAVKRLLAADSQCPHGRIDWAASDPAVTR
jgi:hypothetical protein